MSDSPISAGASSDPDPARAVAEVHRAVARPDAGVTFLFCSPDYDIEALGGAISSTFGESEVVACTTAGEISALGYRRGSLSAVSVSRSVAQVATGRLDGLSEFELGQGEALAGALLDRLRAQGVDPNGRNTFGLLLIDGLSMREESVVSALYRSMGDIQLIGGSAGDGERFSATYIYHEGRFRRDVAVFTLMSTQLPFEVFRTQHFVPSEEKMVVTAADPERRIVTEINGEPAGREYARMVGLEVDRLTPLIFATHPVVVKVGGESYVRSIQKVNDDESLTFFCAIDEGIVLTVANGVDLVENLEQAFSGVASRIGEPQLVLGCDCILRHLELDREGIKAQAGEILRRNNVVGFSTYGEQFNAMHVNQTFTGVAIGAGRGVG